MHLTPHSYRIDCFKYCFPAQNVDDWNYSTAGPAGARPGSDLIDELSHQDLMRDHSHFLQQGPAPLKRLSLSPERCHIPNDGLCSCDLLGPRLLTVRALFFWSSTAILRPKKSELPYHQMPQTILQRVRGTVCVGTGWGGGGCMGRPVLTLTLCVRS